MDSERVRVLVSADEDADLDAALSAFAETLRGLCAAGGCEVVAVGVGSTSGSLNDVRRSLREAQDVVDAVDALPLPDGQPFHRLSDIRLRGLLALLRDDARVQAFVEREVGPLLAHDERQGTDLLRTLEAYLAHGGHKTETAEALFISRSALYDRLGRIEAILRADLTQAESRLSLHVALLALSALRRSPEREIP